jgi:hypothetical protein
MRPADTDNIFLVASYTDNPADGSFDESSELLFVKPPHVPKAPIRFKEPPVDPSPDAM